MASKRISVKKSDPPESKEILAEAIVRIGASMKKLGDSGINETGIIALVHDHTKQPKKTIKLVLNSLRQLEGWYCR